MIIDLTRLRNNLDKYLEIDENISFSKEYLDMTDLLELNDVKVKGVISRNSLSEYDINIVISGTMVLPCAITLKPVNYEFKIELDDNLDRILEENNKKIENTIDILPIIWENILLEVPTRVVSENAKFDKISGDGWKLITEDDNLGTNKLNDLL